MNGILRKEYLLLLASLLLTTKVAAQPDVSEVQIKAAYLLKFPTYVEWPEGTFAEPDSPLVVGVLGADELAGNLEQLGRDLVVGGHPVTIKRLLPGDAAGDLHVLFVGGVTSTAVSGFLQQAVRRPVLTVSEADPPRPENSVINFTISDNKVRFDVAMDPAQRMGLRLSSRLLQVAQVVISETP
jgi:hypothetical protein